MEKVIRTNAGEEIIIDKKVFDDNPALFNRSWSLSKVGYVQANGRNYNGDNVILLHREIAKLYIANIDNKKEIDHLNRIKTDCRIVNLRWCTRSENMNNINKKNRKRRRNLDERMIDNHFKLEKSINLKIMKRGKWISKRFKKMDYRQYLINFYSDVDMMFMDTCGRRNAATIELANIKNRKR